MLRLCRNCDDPTLVDIPGVKLLGSAEQRRPIHLSENDPTPFSICYSPALSIRCSLYSPQPVPALDILDVYRPG